MLVLAACSEGGLRLEAYPDAYLDAYCRLQVRCGALPDVESCRAMYSPGVFDPDLVAAVTAGVIAWQPEVAQACVDWVDSLGCDPTTEEYRRPACFGRFTGTLRDGEACAFGTECISGECWTENLDCTEACCRGTCTGDAPPQIGGIGDPCRYSPCSEGYCEASTCVPLRSAGASCTSDRECDLGLSCDGVVCRRLPGAGEPCSTRCRELGQSCNYLTLRCEPARLLGQECYGFSDCSPHYRCDENQRCSFERAGLGEPCGELACAAPLVCEYSALEGTCVEPKPDGAPCMYAEGCASRSCDALGVCTSEPCI